MTGRAHASRAYSEAERAYAKATYVVDHPDGPPWGSAAPATQARYLDAAGVWNLHRLAAELDRPAARRSRPKGTPVTERPTYTYVTRVPEGGWTAHAGFRGYQSHKKSCLTRWGAHLAAWRMARRITKDKREQQR